MNDPGYVDARKKYIYKKGAKIAKELMEKSRPKPYDMDANAIMEEAEKRRKAKLKKIEGQAKK